MTRTAYGNTPTRTRDVETVESPSDRTDRDGMTEIADGHDLRVTRFHRRRSASLPSHRARGNDGVMERAIIATMASTIAMMALMATIERSAWGVDLPDFRWSRARHTAGTQLSGGHLGTTGSGCLSRGKPTVSRTILRGSVIPRAIERTPQTQSP